MESEETRVEWTKGEHGYFTGSKPGGGSGGNSGNGGKKDLTNKKKGDIINLEAMTVNIPEEKFTRYALDPIKQPDKARAFREALGYTKANYQDLVDNINQHLDKSNMVFREYNGYGDNYEYIMTLTGANGKKANVCTAWAVDNGTDVLRLISVYVTERGATKNG